MAARAIITYHWLLECLERCGFEEADRKNRSVSFKPTFGHPVQESLAPWPYTSDRTNKRP